MNGMVSVSTNTIEYSGLTLCGETQNSDRIKRWWGIAGKPFYWILNPGTEDFVSQYDYNWSGGDGRMNNIIYAKLSDERTYTYCYYEYTPGIEKPTMSWTGRFYSFEGDPNYLDRWLQRYYTYEPLRDSITNVSNYNYQGVLSSYSYDNDTLGRRTNRVDVTPSLTLTNVFGYNAKSEVTRAMMGDNTYGYDYDSIGNRIQSAVAVGSEQSFTNTYTANALNQYTQIDLLPPPSSILPKYDLDGNIITNGVWSYTWDAENRMVSACSNGLLLITNRYDDQSRRIAKIVSLGGTEIQRNTFVYDGWNPIRELRVQGSGVSTNYYCWGPDLSGSLQGAGGVGGLQAVIVVGETPATYYTCYDANGNITAYVDELGNAYAEYAYDAFGNTVSQSGDLASTFSHRFSTKYADDETGLYYYGYRYYAPGLGRWVNRDPLVDVGFIITTVSSDAISEFLVEPELVNVYLFVQNNSVDKLDYQGLTTIRMILSSFFATISSGPSLWVMGQDDAYTRIVRKWAPVKGNVARLKQAVAANSADWKQNHITSSSWTPTMSFYPDPKNGWRSLVREPAGTEPKAARRALIWSLLLDYETEKLHTSSIGSFTIIATADKVDVSKCRAKLNVWMYNEMSRRSFGVFSNHPVFRFSKMSSQFMWWNWKEEFMFDAKGSITDIPPGSGGGW